MDSKTLAETQRICDAGLGAYLSQKHSDFRLRNFSRGVVVGSVFSVITSLFSVPVSLSHP